MSVGIDPTMTTPRLTPAMIHLGVPDADRAMQFFRTVFGWESDRRVTDHVSHFVTNTANVTPRIMDDPTAPPVRLGFWVNDPAGARDAAVAAGGTVVVDRADDSAEGYVELDDGQGTRIALWRPQGTHPHDAPSTVATGDLAYLSIWVADEEQAVGFYQAVLGWPLRAEPGEDARYRHVQNHTEPVAMGVMGSTEVPHIELNFGVADLDAATSRVIAGGGTVGPERRSGPLRVRDCTTDDGYSFVIATMDR